MESIADRTVSALTDRMSVLQIDNERFEVASESGETYEVDLLAQTCGCPDELHRRPEGSCKHVRRAEIAIGRATIPSWVRCDRIDPLLGKWMSGAAR